jgi:hypothetical protein
MMTKKQKWVVGTVLLGGLAIIAAPLIFTFFIPRAQVRQSHIEFLANRTGYTVPSLPEPPAPVELTPEQEQMRLDLLERGFPMDFVEPLIHEGALTALQLPFIRAVQELYGYPWNLTLTVGDFTMVDVYMIDERFILGIYERGEDFIWIRMSVTEPVYMLTGGYVFARYLPYEDYIAYFSQNAVLEGFSFEVLLADEETVATYVATASFTMDDTVIAAFLASVVDGWLLDNQDID